ncbi:MAG TPA: family 1 glycosylhydrolase [Gemmatimonadaceae bacterium]|nr:family 1 glycosylhydrolase [Gemmatimonadaceae bacterium]
MTTDAARPPLQVWAGFECTLNRVGDRQHDQLALTGHYGRIEDLERLAALGVRTIRYPILWEHIAGAPAAASRWAHADAAMRRLRELEIEPIVGLVHHGSGPLNTNLLDDGFAEGLADFAGTVARRYPWVWRFTPVNEPLTTARFSTLYGAWYPHARDARAFWRATLNQIRAIRLSMGAIRAVTPHAMLVQTEDLGFIHATPRLRYQADFENERRWLTFDLLTGRVQPGSAMHGHASFCGVTEDDIARAVGEGCAPDVIGINHYVTSERWLDERLDRFPEHTHGGNERDRYADVEAVRIAEAELQGPRRLLQQAWERYGIPVAVTEAHLGCTREQQLRWLHELWQAAEGARADGVDVVAVTAWAALGTRDWDSLVTRLDGHYEPGLFDVRAPKPRRTALAALTGALARGETPAHPVLESPGWWRAPERAAYSCRADDWPVAERDDASTARPILVTGARGTLGSAVVRLCRERGLACVGTSREELDVADERSVARALDGRSPWAVINAAGYVRVDDAEREPEAAHRANVIGAETLARACAARGLPYAVFSSDLVFDGAGRANRPYVETDPVSPRSVYGTTKAAAEERVLAAHGDSLVVRTAAFVGPWDDWNFATLALRAVAAGVPFAAAGDLVVSPTYVPDLVHAVLDLLIDGEHGIWHLANRGAVTWADLARRAACMAGLDGSLVRACPHTELGLAAHRPPFAALESVRGSLMPSLDDALARYVRTRAWARSADEASLALVQ